MIQGVPRASIIALAVVMMALIVHNVEALQSFRNTWGYCRQSTLAFLSIRGGDDSTEEDLDKKVQAAMRKLGLTGDPSDDSAGTAVAEKENDGTTTSDPSLSSQTATTAQVKEEDVHTMVDRIAKDMHVDKNLVLAAVGATSQESVGDERVYDEDAARNMIEQELAIIRNVSEDSEEVKQLVSEGFDVFLSRRALAFADMDMGNARAILIADQEDEEGDMSSAGSATSSVETQATAPIQPETTETTVDETPTAFTQAPHDPTLASSASNSPGVVHPTGGGSSQQPRMPKPANKADVIFDAASSQIHELVMESPAPVLLYVYADWCGPCKTLSPALEEMAIKAGGAFRLVKVNTDNQKPISGALEVTALPTVFAVKDGKILNSFQGMPNSQQFMQNFMLGLIMPGASFDPPVSAEDQQNYANLSSKLVKAAGTASFSFSQREKLQVRAATELTSLVKATDMVDAGDSAKVLRSLMSNIIRDPYELKFRRVNLQNKVLMAKVASHTQCISILKTVGFVEDGSDALIMGKNKGVVNVAPLIVVRDYIDKWIDKNRAETAKAERKRKDELERSRLAAERELAEDEAESDEDENEKENETENACKLKLRVEGTKKVYESTMDGNEPLSSVLSLLPISLNEGEEVQLTCTAKRLVVKSTDHELMQKSLLEHGLLPVAFIVVKVVGNAEDTEEKVAASSSMLAERAAAKRNRKKGSHTMQSVGIYAKDDKNKGELIDGGSGTLFEHDVTDSESEGEPEEVGDGIEGDGEETAGIGEEAEEEDFDDAAS